MGRSVADFLSVPWRGFGSQGSEKKSATEPPLYMCVWVLHAWATSFNMSSFDVLRKWLKDHLTVKSAIKKNNYYNDWTFVWRARRRRPQLKQKLVEVVLSAMSASACSSKARSQCDAVGLFQPKPANKILCKFMKQKPPMLRTLRLSTNCQSKHIPVAGI